jgi:hypothetical protein
VNRTAQAKTKSLLEEKGIGAFITGLTAITIPRSPAKDSVFWRQP